MGIWWACLLQGVESVEAYVYAHVFHTLYAKVFCPIDNNTRKDACFPHGVVQKHDQSCCVSFVISGCMSKQELHIDTYHIVVKNQNSLDLAFPRIHLIIK